MLTNIIIFAVVAIVLGVGKENNITHQFNNIGTNEWAIQTTGLQYGDSDCLSGL